MSFPTQLTILRIVLVPVFYVLFAVVAPAETGWATVVFVVASVSDWWDGYIARAMNLATPLGAFLDPLADKLLTSAAFVAFASRGYIDWWMVILVISRDVYLTLFRMVSDSVGLPVKTSSLAKVKTFVQMVFIGLLLAALVAKEDNLGAFAQQLSGPLLGEPVLYWSMAIVTFLTLGSAVQYSYHNWAVLRTVGLRYILRRAPQKSI